jgi:hypothetical protein
MAGTPLIAAYVAQIAFWSLLVGAALTGSVRELGLAVFLGLWTVGYFGLPHLAPWTGLLVTPWIALLSIALVFALFKGDVRLT